MMTTLINAASRRGSGVMRAWQTLRRALEIFLQIDGTQRAGAFAHFAFFSLFPAIMLMVAASSVLLDRQRATREILAFIENYVPIGDDKEGYIFRTIEGVAAARGHAGVLAILLLCWGAMRFLATLIRATNRAWGVGIHNWWRLPLKSLALLVILVLSVPVGVLVTVWMKQGGVDGLLQDGSLAVLRRPITMLVPLALLFTGLTLFYRFAPRRSTRLDEVWFAALCTTALLAGAELLFKFYLEHFATLNAVYGALGGIIALLMWIYLSGMIVIFGACLCAAHSHAGPRPGTAART
jgi:YihY family inner membrane protein